MTEHERLLEEFDDAYFALLMEGVAKREGERLTALNEMLRNNPEAAVPESVDQRCLETIDRHFARERRRAGLRKTGKALRLAAVIMAISVLLFTSAFALSEDFRVATLNLMLTVTEKYTQFDIKSSDGNSRQASSNSRTASFEYFENAEIGWLPDGFEYSDGKYDEFAMFENGAGAWIMVILESGEASANVDTENPDSLESVIINGNEGLCITKSDYIHIITVDLDNYLYIDVSTSPDLTVDEVKKIVENIYIRNSRQAVSGRSQASAQYFENAEIGWIPEGFKYTSGEYDRYAWFENDSDDFFYIFLHPGSGTLRIDTENVDSFENISINGNEGICVVKNGAIEIVITDLANYLLIEVSASIDVSVDTAKKIAENIYIRNSGQAVSGRSQASVQYFENAEIGWIPEGFECIESIPNTRVKFGNEQGDYFVISIKPGSARVNVDTENPESLEHITINGNEGLCVVKYGEVEIMLADLENYLYIEVGTSSGISVETAKKIAENILII